MELEGEESSKERSRNRSRAVTDNVFRGLRLGSGASFLARNSVIMHLYVIFVLFVLF